MCAHTKACSYNKLKTCVSFSENQVSVELYLSYLGLDQHNKFKVLKSTNIS